ncbi:DUF2971 domain-containing protein [Pseudomonas sp. Irchel 3H7]|uniref:DUF2971 domain-containing protein n=1 Tax=Pseudomonas sp. Irchel 3H7 TaxID=2009042 RepID=UPI000BA36E1F|nr:DUF2971 domain-containing protein [Pseudomonas sp. Irchel 3H7]
MSKAEVVRVYHFCNYEYGLKNIINRRLKVARIMELNDPFELMAYELTDKVKREAVKNLKIAFALQFGFLCFSRSYRSPVQWAHYGDKHKGICLGFDVSSDILHQVEYTGARKIFHPGLVDTQEKAFNWLMSFFSTKHRSWSYEREMRLLKSLRSSEKEGDLYFTKFGAQLELKRVIAGCNFPDSNAAIRDALGEELNMVEVFKARPAFSKFEIVRDKSVWR